MAATELSSSSSRPLFTQNGDSLQTPVESPAPGGGQAGEEGSAGSSTLPAFLQQSRGDLRGRFVDLEWQQRNRLSAGIQSPATEDNPGSPWSRLDSVANQEIFRRNRYMNVEPFAANRVRLRVPQGVSDYINASPISLSHTVSGAEKRYIATQGPKEGSESHIWRMIYAETGAAASPAVVVMLTQTHESGKEKCFQYFPLDLHQPELAINETDEFADGFRATLTLQSVTEDPVTRSTLREIDLSTNATAAEAICVDAPPPATDAIADLAQPSTTAEQDGATAAERPPVHKKVYHMLFGGWPDFLVPEGDDRAALLGLVARSQELNHPPSNPRVVHCSAGVGRSGTFIALDYLLQEIAEGAWDDVSAFDPPATNAGGLPNGDSAHASTSPANAATLAADDAGLAGREAGNRDSFVGVGRGRDPIFDIVDNLRQQRMMMVQGEGQYLFLYEVCREAWLERWKGSQR